MHGIGVKCCLASHRETVGQESEYQLIPQFRILIVSAVKICKRCLQTASVTAGLRPQINYRRLAPGPHWGISIPQSHMKVPGAAIGQCAASLKLRQYGTIKMCILLLSLLHKDTFSTSAWTRSMANLQDYLALYLLSWRHAQQMADCSTQRALGTINSAVRFISTIMAYIQTIAVDIFQFWVLQEQRRKYLSSFHTSIEGYALR